MLDFACKKFDIRDVVRCSLSLSKAECRLLQFLLYEQEPMTTSAIAEAMEVDRTTVQKAIKSLVDKNVVIRLQQNLDKGGYIFRYSVKDKEVLKNRIKDIVTKWYQKVLHELDRW
mgnify:CR=1 FL=1